MRRVLLIPVAVAAGALLLAAPAADASRLEAVTTPSEQAIAAFSTKPALLERSFAQVNEAYFATPVDLRSAALEYLTSTNADLHLAAVYALALTAAPGKPSAALAALLPTSNLTERILAASGLTGIGDRQGLPYLIDSLASTRGLGYWNPPMRLWELARAELLDHTDRDFGLAAARTAAAALQTKAAWLDWWTRFGGALRWDARAERFMTPGSIARTLSARRATPLAPDSRAEAAAAGEGTQVKVLGTTVTITVPIDVFANDPVRNGNGGTTTAQALADAWKKGAQDRWNAAFRNLHYRGCGTSPADGFEFHLNVDIEVHRPSEHIQDGRHHVIVVDRQEYFRSHNGASSGSTDVPNHGGKDGAAYFTEGGVSAWWSGFGGDTAAHEIAHLFGLGDDYVDLQQPDGTTESKELRGREGTMMADYRHPRPGKPLIDQQLIDRLGKLFRRATLLKCPPKPKTKTKHKAPPKKTGSRTFDGRYRGTIDGVPVERGEIGFFTFDVRHSVAREFHAGAPVTCKDPFNPPYHELHPFLSKGQGRISPAGSLSIHVETPAEGSTKTEDFTANFHRQGRAVSVTGTMHYLYVVTLRGAYELRCDSGNLTFHAHRA